MLASFCWELMHERRSKPFVSLRPRLRVSRGREIALGPGRVDLLELIAETGSLRAAANRMDMSYMRAWTLVKSLNRCFREPLVEVSRGGKLGGGAKLTLTGRNVIGLYRRMEKESERAVKQSWTGLQRYLRARADR